LAEHITNSPPTTAYWARGNGYTMSGYQLVEAAAGLGGFRGQVELK